jgi:hypothetical protein
MIMNILYLAIKPNNNTKIRRKIIAQNKLLIPFIWPKAFWLIGYSVNILVPQYSPSLYAKIAKKPLTSSTPQHPFTCLIKKCPLLS